MTPGVNQVLFLSLSLSFPLSGAASLAQIPSLPVSASPWLVLFRTGEIASTPLFVFDVLPWWVAAPLLQLAILVAGMALDETYVNRTTVLAGALALAVHALVAGETGLFVGIYLDVGLVVGVYGLYAYVVDAYVGNWFRIAAYFAYSPLAIFLVIILPDVLFPFAIVAAGYANLQLMAYFDPTEPYYFGPESPDEFESAVEATETATGPNAAPSERASSDGETESVPGDGARDDAAGTGSPEAPGPNDGPVERDVTAPGADPAATGTGGRSTERGILPEFMRRL